MSTPSARLFSPGSWPETSRIAGVLRKETVGGVLLLAGALIALAWANSPWAAGYETLRDAEIGPASKVAWSAMPAMNAPGVSAT